MLTYFFENITIPAIYEVKKLINQKKEKLLECDYINAFTETKQSKEFFDIINLHAKAVDEELLANASYVHM